MNNRLLNDTIPDESQQGLLDSLAWLSHDIPPDIQMLNGGSLNRFFLWHPSQRIPF
ncbi:MAG: hypothetical protein IT240_07285 [Bacteroidia bacterium]|nr:hypothetical protein [Bacteroidia bacterium]MCC6768830.1 hypothetical protein [Bacteroidia bacterium]